VAAAPQAPPYRPKATRLNTPLPWTQPEGSVPSSAAAKRTRWTVARASALMERRCSAHSSVLLDGERADEADDGSSIREDPTTSVRRRSPLLRPTGPQNQVYPQYETRRPYATARCLVGYRSSRARSTAEPGRGRKDVPPGGDVELAELGWGEVAERTMGSHGVVAVPIVLEEHSGLANGGEQLSIEYLLADLGAKRLAHPVAPRGARVGEPRAHPKFTCPAGHDPCYELWAVVDSHSEGLPVRRRDHPWWDARREHQSSAPPRTPSTSWCRRPPRTAPAAPSRRSSRRTASPRLRSRSPESAGGHPSGPQAAVDAASCAG